MQTLEETNRIQLLRQFRCHIYIYPLKRCAYYGVNYFALNATMRSSLRLV